MNFISILLSMLNYYGKTTQVYKKLIDHININVIKVFITAF